MGTQNLQKRMSEADSTKGNRRSSTYSTLDMKENRSCLEKIALSNSLAKETLSEFFGTCLLVTFTCCSVATSVLNYGSSGGALGTTIGCSLAVTMAVYATGGVSGGHVNPAVSFAMCMTGKLSWVKLPFYISAQFLGAFTGSAAVFGVYYDALIKYSGGVFTVTGPNATAHIFATYPSPYLSTLNGLADQMMSTALLLILIFAIFDKKNMPAPSGLEPIAVGLLILTLALSLGSNCGGAMNPARDLGPRIFTALAGWGSEVFTAGNSFWWIPVVGPMCGAVIGSYIYILCIQAHHKKEPGVLDHNPDIDHFEKHELASMA
ncbi:aquaporin-9 isoform X1 [Ranitomeya variabilis]|uniref:aquaporin-9 isoform X1 n=1 Tax=Ranitomeya variabilis TaxID=490064 RepID=UPI004056530F